MVHSANNTLKTRLMPSKRSSCTADSVGAGCYSFKCSNCELRYIGQTGRSVETRVREHKQNLRLGREGSAVWQHFAQSGHDINFNSNQCLFKSTNLSNRLVVESALIKEIPNFNNTSGTCSVDNLSSRIILSSNKFLKNSLSNLTI